MDQWQTLIGIDYVSLAGIAVGLSMDAFAVSLTDGAVSKKVTWRYAGKIALAFGLFQGFMPFLGWLVGTVGAGLISSLDHWIALILLGYLGVQMLRESRNHKESGGPLRDGIAWKALLVSAVATSIDALATGILLPSAVGASTIPAMILSVSLIALVTFLLCFPGVYIGKRFGALLSSKAEVLGGIVLIGIGLKIFVEHTFF